VVLRREAHDAHLSVVERERAPRPSRVDADVGDALALDLAGNRALRVEAAEEPERALDRVVIMARAAEDAHGSVGTPERDDVGRRVQARGVDGGARARSHRVGVDEGLRGRR
jgi:hypothetical protein